MENKISRGDFLKLGLTASLAAVALTACGKVLAMGENKPSLNEVIVGEDNFVTARAVLAENKYINFIYQGKRCILVYNDGKIKAFENICTHKGGKNELHGDKLVCLWHGATFDPLTGEALQGPAPVGSKLPEIGLREQDGKIYVDA